MSKVWLLAHIKERFTHDFCCAGTHQLKPPCPQCGVNMNELVPPLLYRWEDEFGDPELSLRNGHDCLWGDLRLMVNDRGRKILDSLHLKFEFLETLPVETKLVRSRLEVTFLPLPDRKWYWARPTQRVDADVLGSRNEICDKCGQFTKKIRQLNGLRICGTNSSLPGLFSIRQNCEGPIFVTEHCREILEASGLKGIGYYPAGKVMD